MIKPTAEEVLNKLLINNYNPYPLLSEFHKRRREAVLKLAPLAALKSPSENALGNIKPISPDFGVFSYPIGNTDGLFECSETNGLKMVITKNGVTIELESDEIQQLVNTLPRTFGQSYKQN